MKKRIVALITAFVLVSSMSLISVYGADAEVSYTDEYLNAGDVLSAICPDIPTGDEGQYTRAEFVAAVINLMKLSDFKGTTEFMDVPADHIYASHIGMAVSMGLINSQNMFYPDAPITYIQAIKIATSAIGYGVRADVLGGYPAGYVLAAKEAKIGRDLAYANDAALSYKDGAAILYDMAVADMYDMTTVGSSVEYAAVKGRNILSTYYDIKICEGVVKANEFTGLYSSGKSVADGRIMIDNAEFVGEDFYNLIGKRVRAFYKDESLPKIVWAYAADNKVLEFDPEYTLDISGYKLTAAPNDASEKEKDYKLASGYAVIRNGKSFDAPNYSSYINPKAGSVTLIDYDDNNTYDVIIIEDIQYGFIEKVNVLGKKIYDKYKSSSSVDLSDPDTKYFIYDADGKQIELDAVENNTTAGYVKSADGDYVKIKLYDNAYGGVISEKTSDNKIKVRDNYYDVSDYYLSMRAYNSIQLGAEVICYLGEGDDIIYMENINGETRYGFLVARATPSGSIDSATEVKLMTAEEGMIVLPLANKVNVNGDVKSTTAASADIDAIIAMADRYRAVKFFVNAEGKLNKIHSAVMAENLDHIFEETGEDDAPRAFISSSDGTYEENRVGYYTEGILSPNIIPTAATSVVMIPASAADRLVDKNYEALDMSAFKTDETYYYIAYDVDAAGCPKFMVILESAAATELDDYSTPLLVEKVYKTLDEEGSTIDCIKGFSKGNYMSFYVTEDSDPTAIAALSSIKPGDILRISYNNKNIIKKINLDFIYDTKSAVSSGFTSMHTFTGGHNGDEIEFIGGYIYNVSGSNALLVQSLSGTISSRASIFINLGRGITVFCKINRDRLGNAVDAEVFTEPDFSTIQSWRNSGDDAYYMVARQRFRQSGLNVIYID